MSRWLVRAQVLRDEAQAMAVVEALAASAGEQYLPRSLDQEFAFAQTFQVCVVVVVVVGGGGGRNLRTFPPWPHMLCRCF